MHTAPTLFAALDELRVAGVRTLADLGSSYLEVTGSIVMRQSRRLSDYANHPDPMLELDAAKLRLQGQTGPQLWEEVEALSLNRDRLLLLIPFDENDPGHNPELHVRGRPARVKIICRAMQVTGFIRVPVNATIASFIHVSRARFLAVTQARVARIDAASGLGAFEGVHDFCLVNRAYIVACIETRTPDASEPAPQN
jgi:hypothetical protein